MLPLNRGALRGCRVLLVEGVVRRVPGAIEGWGCTQPQVSTLRAPTCPAAWLIPVGKRGSGEADS